MGRGEETYLVSIGGSDRADHARNRGSGGKPAHHDALLNALEDLGEDDECKGLVDGEAK